MRVKPHRLKFKMKQADPKQGSAVSIFKASRTKTLWLLIGLLLLLAIAAFFNSPVLLLNFLARQSLSNLDYPAAEHWIKRTSYLTQGNAESEMIAARIARHEGRLDQMADHLSKASRLGADRQAIQIEEAMALAQNGKLDEVEADLFRWLSNGIGDADEISDAYANGLAANSRFDNANEILDAWQRDFPKDPRPEYRLGRLNEHLQLWEQAAEAYLNSLKKKNDYYPSRFRLGRAYFTVRKIEEAKKSFEECLKMRFPEAAKIQLAFCYRALGESDQARDILYDVLQQSYETILRSYHAVEESPEHFEAASTLGDIESESGNYQEAYKWLKLAVEKNPRDLTARYSLALTMRRLGQTEQAEKDLAEIEKAKKALERANSLRVRIEAKPDDLEARLELGKLLIENESMRMGRFWLQSIFKFDPNHREAHRALAEHYRQLSETSPEFRAQAEFHKNLAEGKSK